MCLLLGMIFDAFGSLDIVFINEIHASPRVFSSILSHDWFSSHRKPIVQVVLEYWVA